MDKKGVLIFVDDDPIVLETLEIELEPSFGKEYRFETAMDAQEALDLIQDGGDKKLKVFLIVSDWLMPGMKGDEFLIEVYKRWPDIKCMMLTGQANEDAVQNAKENSRMVMCLRKPWMRDELIAAVERALKSR